MQKCFPRFAVTCLQRKLIVAPDGGLWISLWAGRNGLRRNQGYIVATERPVNVRLLLVAGVLENLVADEAEGAPEIEAGFWEMLDQRGGERAVFRIAVRRRRAGLGRERDHRVRACRFDLCQSTTDRARRNRSLHRPGEGVVPASIKNNEPQLFGRLDRKQDTIKRQRFVKNVGIRLQCRIYRNEVVGAVQLDSVPGVVDHRHIGVAGLAPEIAKGLSQIGGSEI